ncbi:uncharacterized protein LOC131322745 isoform X3 [Rhododendron vialii]|uniref:uncharacterized protein LOC131322745 isoform X3 n=1 Tax=Rhododendron vialii TaxID=182163 RepID=UPI00265ECBA7|nr:uncharacterized protein LOC131322745 isoform X3 [Rhododendron vialii]XP_058210164.1 uncharacterized protein LOC131322745 isoform X3 [Rhododendron vialii]XP_058210165.1 uncharacterized protein LOC131322745 isoform X3 [Rhododendron vialii]XP_058210166.1 uncharacterized protein LOC131322745 isoform X3 [Rhododendron vialii]XP_058210167.1 uncharacterized protein LOC131322745 isoform X3 [Rhododendron vialii]XP_058210168.1 uncharacterized protein LOC131322745 isoform X3 [Rhododendron vialii]
MMRFAGGRFRGLAFLKLNVDGEWKTVANAGEVAGAGMVVQNSNGDFVAARACHLGRADLALSAEALAWRQAMEFAVALGLDSLIIEADSLQLVRLVEQYRMGPAGVDVIVEDIRRMGSMFRRCKFRFVRRTANSVAHVLAQPGLRGSSSKTWEVRPPCWLLKSLRREPIFLM